MAKGEYLKVAASHIRRAAEAEKAEIDELRKAINDKERFKQNREVELTMHQQRMQSEAAHTDSSQEKALRMQQVMNAQTEKSKLKHEIDDEKSQLQKVIQGKEQEMNGLLQEASNLEKRA